MAFFTVPGPESEKFFMMLASSQGKRLDDQRVSLASLPGIQNGSTTSAPNAADIDASHLYNMVSKVQVGPIKFCSFYCLIPQNLTLFADKGCLTMQPTLSQHYSKEWIQNESYFLHTGIKNGWTEMCCPPDLPGYPIYSAQRSSKLQHIWKTSPEFCLLKSCQNCPTSAGGQ